MNVRVGNDYILCLQTVYGVIDSLLVSQAVAAVLLHPDRVDLSAAVKRLQVLPRVIGRVVVHHHHGVQAFIIPYLIHQ